MSNPNDIPRRTIRLAVIHWFPLEQFPPAQNLINFLADHSNIEVLSFTTRRLNEPFPFANKKSRVIRTAFPETSYGKLLRLLQFIWFPLNTLLRLIYFRPNCIFYYEPQSAPAAFLYSIINPWCRVFIHHHEYREPEHFSARGNTLARLGHWLELFWLFRRSEWISQTNSDRIRLFLNDCPHVSPLKLHELPNMPPQSWVNKVREISRSSNSTLRLVYIGAISLHDTYLEPLLGWFTNIQSQGVTLDLYINNLDSATKSFLSSQKQDGLTVHMGGVAYEQLPTILPHYDIGLILYRCNSVNYIYNAPNKLFEYLVCGLNVLYPTQMLGVTPFARSDFSPWVKSIEFERLPELSVDQIRDCNVASKPWNETCETVYKPLLKEILRR